MAFPGERASWQELDKLVWKKVGEGEDTEYLKATEEFFGHLYRALTGKYGDKEGTTEEGTVTLMMLGAAGIASCTVAGIDE